MLVPEGDTLNSGEIKKGITNYHLLLLYAAPYFVYVGMGTFERFVSISWVYILRILIVPAVLVWAWPWYRPMNGVKNWAVSVLWGGVAGVAGLVLWIALLAPFVNGSSPSGWGDRAFYLRLVSSSLIVPVFEELLMRGYVFFFVLQWDNERKSGRKKAFEWTLHEASIDDVREAYWNIPAIIISAVVFSLGHQPVEWPASMAYGALMAILLIIRKDLLSCIVAHGTTNFCLGIYVILTNSWQYW